MTCGDDNNYFVQCVLCIYCASWGAQENRMQKKYVNLTSEHGTRLLALLYFMGSQGKTLSNLWVSIMV